jgi:hypothetical protein
MQPEWRRNGKELFYVPEPTAPYPNHYALTVNG